MNLNNIKRYLRKLILRHDVHTYFFSQSGEDAILLNIFAKKFSQKEKGYYIDVGAYHPSALSNTCLFYMNGWTGINIDARPGSMDLFKKLRPKDINLEMGISNSSKELTYYVIDDISSMNSFSKEHLDELGMQEHIKTEIQIKTYKLSEVLDKYLPSGQIIDFLNIDVEGFDQEVLFSNNWEKYRPRVLVVELSGKTLQDILENSITKYLSKLDYDVYGKTVILNCISSVVFIDRSFDF